MNFKETKFAYRHKPTGKWVFIETFSNEPKFVLMHLVDDFCSDIIYSARNIIEEDLMRSRYKGEKYAAKNLLEFELVEIEIEYKIKENP
jgi:hypothetical protein